MKPLRLLLKFCFMLLLFISSKNVLAQPYPNTGDHQVCLNANEPYGVVLTAGSTYAWSVTPVTTGNGTITVGATPNLITVNWTSVGTATLQVIETNAQGCPGDPVNITVTINPIPVLVITSPSVCGAGTADLTAATVTAGSTGGLTFTYWTDAAATLPYPTPTAAGAGTYYIKGTLAGGCVDIKPVTVVTTAAPTLTIINPSVCGTGTADLTAAAVTAGSTPGLVYTYWTDAAATLPYATPTIAGAGTYYIKGTLAGGCFDIKPVTVSTTAAPTVVITNPAAVCGTGTVDLTAAAITAGSTGGLVYTYWTDAAATIPYTTPTTAGAGNYYIKGTLAGGCFDIKLVVVAVNPSPAPAITGPTPVCVSINGSTSTYSTPDIPGHTYSWSVAGGTIASGQNTNQINVTWTTAGPGTVSVTETITATSCSTSVVKNITVTPKPVTSQITHN
jgi:large repetitive protein